MASTVRPATKGVSTKSIVKYLSKYCAISVEDLTNPNVSTHANGGDDHRTAQSLVFDSQLVQ